MSGVRSIQHVSSMTALADLRAERRAAGLCLECPDPGKPAVRWGLCPEHAARQQKRAQRAEIGKRRCGLCHCGRPLATNQERCGRCRLIRARRAKAKRRNSTVPRMPFTL